jgi:hypothetical protein
MKNLSNKIKNIKHVYIIALVFFIIYLALGILFSYRGETYKTNNFFFEADNFRALYDLTSFEFNHYRTKVHPIFVLLFQPIAVMFNILFKSDILSVIVLESIIAALNIITIYKIFKTIKIKEKMNIILTLIYGFSFSSLIFVSIPETFVFASFLLLLMWLYIIKLFYSDKKINTINYIVLVLTGIGALSITVTNFVQFIIAIFFLLLYKQKTHKIIKSILATILLTIISFGITSGLALIQKKIWPTAMNFHEYLVDFSYNDKNEEKYYMSKNIEIQNIKESYKTVFVNSFVPNKIIIKNEMAWFSKPNILSIMLSLVLISFIIFGIIKAFLKKDNPREKLLITSITGSLLYNFVLHLIYGTYESFLYSQHFTFLVIILIGLGFKNARKKYRNISFLIFVAYLLLQLILNLNSLLTLNKLIIEKYGIINDNLKNVYLLNFLKGLLLVNLPYSIYNIIRNRKIRHFLLTLISIFGILYFI